MGGIASVEGRNYATIFRKIFPMPLKAFLAADEGPWDFQRPSRMGPLTHTVPIPLQEAYQCQGSQYREFVESPLISGINFGGPKTMTHQGFGYSDHPLIFVGCSCDPGQRNPKELVLKIERNINTSTGVHWHE